MLHAPVANMPGAKQVNHDLLMRSLTKFYECDSGSHYERIETVKAFIRGTSPFSLRLVDWFVTNYCKKHKVFIDMKRSHTDVFTSYRSQLKAFSKHMFDPFRRNHRIVFVYDAERGGEVETTVGQLNFFRWVLEQGILPYIGQHKHDIEDDMNQIQHRSRYAAVVLPPPPVPAHRAIGPLGRRRRCELSESRFKTLSQCTGNLRLEFC